MATIQMTLPALSQTAPPGAAPAWAEAVEGVLAHAASAPDALARTLAAAPAFAPAHAARGLMLLLLAKPEVVATAREALALAREGAASSADHAYADALALFLDGHSLAAADRLEDILDRSPTDALALKLAHQIRFQAGDKGGMLAALHGRADAFAGGPAHGFVLGCLAFALEETGDYGAAEAAGLRAIEIAPRDAWGRHAVAHALEMTGRSDDGAAWLGRTADSWAHTNNFSYHLWWHLALFLLDQGRVDEVLDLHDRQIRARRTDDYRDLANGAALLQRLELEGVAVGDRWDELATIAASRVGDRRLVFADLHYLIALLGAGREDEALRIASGLATPADRGGHDGDVALGVGSDAARGLVAFRSGDHAAAVRLLERVRDRMVRIGGSDAQRDLFEQVLIESALRLGDAERATALLEHRLAARGGRNLFAARRLAALAPRTPEARAAVLAIGAAAVAADH